MSFQQLLEMRSVGLTSRALWRQVKIIVQRSWQQCDSGPWRWCKFFVVFSRYLAMIMFGLLLLSSRMRIVTSTYCWFRIVDNILDGDAEPPHGYSRASYRERVEVIMMHLQDLRHCPVAAMPEDLLLVHIIATCRGKGISILPEMQNLWSVMAWDFDRRQASIIEKQSTLQHYAALQDKTIIAGCVKMLGGSAESVYNLPELSFGVFTRIDWLADLSHDLHADVVNIPLEAIHGHELNLGAVLQAARVSKRELMGISGMRQWHAEELASIRHQWLALRRPLARALMISLRQRFRVFIVHRPLVRAFEYTLNKTTHS